MKNLAISRPLSKVLKDTVQEFIRFKTCQELWEYMQCTINPSNNDLYVWKDKYISVISIEGQNSVVIDFTPFYFSKVIALEYCTTVQELFCAYESGCIAKLELKDFSRFEYSVGTTFNSGLQCMKLSPDHELIVAVTNPGIVVTMAVDFHIISEENLYSEDFGQNAFINVGWGRKETQFHGSAGKAAAQAGSKQQIPNEHDNGRTRITWREDGSLFAVNFLHKDTKIRKFKVFNREGILCYTNDQANGLEEYTAWSPIGHQIAITQKLDDKYFVTFFEKNGLENSQLRLCLSPREVKVKDLLWSEDILVVVYEQLKTDAMLIQLWTQSNFHWYLKQTLVFPKTNPLLCVKWSNIINETNKKQLVYLTPKELTYCSFYWCLNLSRGKVVNDKAVCGVIDGNRILVTAFKDGIIPPPMAHQTFETSEPQNAIIFAPNINNESSLITSNEFCTVSCNNKLTFYKQKKDSFTLTHVMENCYDIGPSLDRMWAQIKLGTKEIHYYANNFLWFTEDIMLISIIGGPKNVLYVLSLNPKDLTVLEGHIMDSPIEHIVSSPDPSTAYIKAEDQIFKYTLHGSLERTNITLNKLCMQMEVIKIDSKDVILALSLEKNFFVNGEEVAKNITSFYVHSDFLLLTTHNTLVCVPLNKVGLKELSDHDLTKPWQNEMKDIVFTNIYIRKIEENSRVLVAIPYDSQVILQMPRGNLESIQPKTLAIYILKRYLNNCDYLTALAIMIKNRVNLNLIYDHDPKLFLDNVEKIVEDLVRHDKKNWLNFFLLELQSEDITTSMYAYCYTDRIVKSGATSNETTVDKIEKICKILNGVMENREDAECLIESILISLVKTKQREGLENALRKIKQMKMLENSQRSVQSSTRISALDSLKYLVRFVDIDTLYDVALGMYDLELAMFVASQSSKDPKEYVQVLNDLNKLEENQMKYTIDYTYLKRYESALEHLSKNPTKFEECLNLIYNHKLYKSAIKLFKKNTTEYKKIAALYGEFLSSEKKYLEAGMLFYRSGDFARAIETFSMSSNNWEDVIAISKELNLSLVNLYELYKKLAEHLDAERKYEHAAVICKDYLKDIEETITLLCKGKLWKNAIRIANDSQRFDLHETHIKPGVKEHADHVISQLTNMNNDFLRHKSRLAAVRKEIKTKQIQLPVDNICELELDKEVPDFVSDITSIADSVSTGMSQMSISSKSSSKSFRSSKNRRKQERKLYSLKEGSMFEDLSLIHALYKIISNAYKDKDEWYQLVQVLIRFEYDESAEKILVKAKKFFQLVEDSKSEIWDRSAPTSLTDIEKSGNYTPAQIQEMIAPVKSIERYITYPPEVDSTTHADDLLKTFF